MTTFDVYKHRIQGYEAVKQGFSWPAFFFTWIWALVKRLWIPAVVGFLLTGAVQGISDTYHDLLRQKSPYAAAVNPLMCLVYATAISSTFGLMGNNWRSTSLPRRGFEFVASVAASMPSVAIERAISDEEDDKAAADSGDEASPH